MTLLEFRNQFELLYQSSANTAPDINTYEISLFLTKAVDELINTAIASTPDMNEYNRRLIQPLVIPNKKIEFSKVPSEYKQFNKIIYYLPKDLRYTFVTNLTSNTCKGLMTIVTDKLDYLRDSLKNPFRKPKDDRAVLIMGGSDSKGDFNIIYISKETSLDSIDITYLKKNNPIIIEDLELDPLNMGDETIKGLNTETETEIAEEFHSAIVDLAVAIADNTIKR